MSFSSKTYYLIDLKSIVNRFYEFKNILGPKNKEKVFVSYSIKANYNEQIILELDKNGAFFDVSSFFEYKKLLDLGINGEKIIVNGPYYENDELNLIFKNKSCLILDSPYANLYLASCEENVNAGIRISNNQFIDYNGKPSHFGFEAKSNELNDILSICKKKNIHLKMLHIHCSGNNRLPELYKNNIKYLIDIKKQYNISENISLNIGGGYKIGYNFYSIDDYKKCLMEYGIKLNKLYLEVGNSMVRDFVEYHSKIVIIKETSFGQLCVIDGSILHFNPHIKDFHPEINVIRNNNCGLIRNKIVIVGKTCKESDEILTLHNCEELKIGDEIVVKGIGAYCQNEVSDFILNTPITLTKK